MKEMEERFNKMQENWTSLLEKQQTALEKMSGELRSVERKPPQSEPEMETDDIKQDPSIAISQTIVEDKTFNNFVVDDANRFPYLAAELATRCVLDHTGHTGNSGVATRTRAGHEHGTRGTGSLMT